MEKNIVIVELDKYEELILYSQATTNKLKEIEKARENNFLIPKDCIRVVEEGGKFKLSISIKELTDIANRIEGYVARSRYSSDVEISNYHLVIEKVVE